MKFSVKALTIAALLATVLTGCGRTEQGNGRNILLITLETTRADHLGVNGYYRETSPHLDAFAAEGVNFENALSVSPRTNPSLASLMTSLYPHEHGVRSLPVRLDKRNTTLAETLRDAGYYTMAVMTHPWLVKSRGFEQGFDVYDDHLEQADATEAFGHAKKLLDRAGRNDDPWFLWVHLMDPHWFYYPPEGWRDIYNDEDPRPVQLYWKIDDGEEKFGPIIFQNRMDSDEVQGYIDLYDAEIRFTDEAVGDFLQVLKDRGLYEETIVVVTADHGESLGEHDYFFEHGDFGREPEIHVPLMFRAPNLRPQISSVPWTVQSIDVLPTLLELAGLSRQSPGRGTSLLPLLSGVERTDRYCFGETGRKFHPENTRREVGGTKGKWRWVRKGRFKLLFQPTASGYPKEEFFDLQNDPGEQRNARADFPEKFATMRQLLQEWMSEDAMNTPESKITPGMREQLKALGYID